jgi:cytoskeletal protein CcmA (bactofilin family)
MFEKRENKTTNDNAISGSINLIGIGTVINGDLVCKGDIRIDGEIIGNVHSKSKVVIGATGRVTGNVEATNMDLSGLLRGDVEVTETIYLKANSNLIGNMITNKLVVEAGAVFNGLCRMGQGGNASLENVDSELSLAN